MVAPAARQTLDAAPADRYEYELKSLASWLDGGRAADAHFLFRAPGETLRHGRDLERGRFQTRRFTAWDGAIGHARSHDGGWSPASLSGIASPPRL